MKIKLFIKFNKQHSYDDKLVNKLRTIPECQNHRIIYNDNELEMEGEISYSSNDFVIMVFQLIEEENLLFDESIFNTIQ